MLLGQPATFKMIGFFRFVPILIVIICVVAEEKNVENKGDKIVSQENPSIAEANKHRLAKILEDLRSLDHHHAKKLRRILMYGKVQRKINKALRKEAEKFGNKNILMQLRASDAKNSGKDSKWNMHQLKRVLKLSKIPSLDLERGFKREKIAHEEKTYQRPEGKSDQKITEDDKAAEKKSLAKAQN